MGINETGVSRRSFITGAAAAGVLATLGLAGCAPQDKQTASAATSGADTKWDEECDVLVVGSGYTGLAAALEAKNAGAAAATRRLQPATSPCATPACRSARACRIPSSSTWTT